MSIKIKFRGNEYWFIGDSFEEAGAIAPLEHCNEKGELDFSNCFKTDSYGHYYPNKGISRYGKIIGKLEDIEIIK